MRTGLASILILAIAIISNHASASQGIELTPEESQWLDSHNIIRLGSDSAWPPLDYRDENMIPAGMCADYFRYAADKLGIEIVIGPELGWAEVMHNLKEKQLDAVTCLAQNDNRNEFVSFSTTVTDIPQVIITNDEHPYISNLGDLVNERIAMVDGYAVESRLRENYPELVPVIVNTPLDALKAVATGQADAFVGVLAVAVHLIENKNLANLKVAAPADIPPLELRFGFRKDWPQMAALFSKAMQTMTPQEHTAIAQHWVNIKYDPVIDYALLWKVGGTLTVLLMLALLWIRQVQRQKRLLLIQRDTLQKLTADLEVYGARVAKELDMARQTQTVLLPDTSSLQEIMDVHDIHIDSRFEPSSELGGDFWGLENLGDNHVTIHTVDFSGHGINAALNTFRLHALLDSEKNNNDDPALYLEHLNKRLSPLLPAGQYATMFYGIIDRSMDLLTYAGAATPSPLVFLPGQDAPLIGVGEGFPLGMFDESTYENRELPFPVGASLLLYSDAATEGKMKQGGRLEEEGLITVTRQCLETSNRENLVKTLKQTLDTVLDQPLADDLTIVCATRLK